MFIPGKKYIKYFRGTDRIDLWKSKRISEEKAENITKSDNNFEPTFLDHHLLAHKNFNGHCLVKHNFSISKKKINLYISDILTP